MIGAARTVTGIPLSLNCLTASNLFFIVAVLGSRKDLSSSDKLLIDMGFEKEGYLRSEWETHLGVRDSILWGLLKDDYKRG